MCVFVVIKDDEECVKKAYCTKKYDEKIKQRKTKRFTVREKSDARKTARKPRANAVKAIAKASCQNDNERGEWRVEEVKGNGDCQRPLDKAISSDISSILPLPQLKLSIEVSLSLSLFLLLFPCDSLSLVNAIFGVGDSESCCCQLKRFGRKVHTGN